MVYSIAPYEQKEAVQQEIPNYEAQIAELTKQIESIKKQLGGKLNELL